MCARSQLGRSEEYGWADQRARRVERQVRATNEGEARWIGTWRRSWPRQRGSSQRAVVVAQLDGAEERQADEGKRPAKEVRMRAAAVQKTAMGTLTGSAEKRTGWDLWRPGSQRRRWRNRWRTWSAQCWCADGEWVDSWPGGRPPGEEEATEACSGSAEKGLDETVGAARKEAGAGQTRARRACSCLPGRPVSAGRRRQLGGRQRQHRTGAGRAAA